MLSASTSPPPPPPPHAPQSFIEAAPHLDDASTASAPHSFTDTAEDDTDPSSLPSLLYDDIDHPATSTTTLLLTARHQHAAQQLQQTISQLTEQLSHSQQQLVDSRRQTDKYKAQCAVFVRNISVLYETAVSEVKRKQEEIDRLKEWKAAQERRTRMAAAERQHTSGGQAHYGASNVATGNGVLTQQLPPPPLKRAYHAMSQPHLPQPPFPLPDSTKKRARVDTG